MPPTVPQSVKTPHQTVGWWFTEERSQRTRQFAGCFILHTDHLDWSLPAHYRGTLSGMDAAPE
ncbi:hypothetical protein M3O38_17895, partial [Xanthomonas nasturtii]|nr:hypothetical protein [Xanthomonas nasturtii]MCL1553313.1 hypothetical protein [Xanthomonas nasturtii]MCL1557206.1 hypothetical protein [Xanthomonas nasturtii]MCL1586457.1 hypothetical protein [Xanthomonas nasturtii]